MRRPFFLYLCSNSPYYAILLMAICVKGILLIKICDFIFEFRFEFSHVLTYGFEPVLMATIASTTISSVVVYIYFWYDLNKSKELDNQTRKLWKKRLLRTIVLANSYYYDFKYPKKDKDFFLEQFVKKSRDRMLGN